LGAGLRLEKSSRNHRGAQISNVFSRVSARIGCGAIEASNGLIEGKVAGRQAESR
jgi:hypothetical protein